MSSFTDQPFDEREQRYFLAEIIKDSPIPPLDLVTIIKQVGIQPRWTEIALPNGRSVSACQKAFENLLSHSSTGFPVTYRPTDHPEPKASAPKPKKRGYASGDGSMAVDRIIQPRVSEFSAVNEPFSSPHQPPAPVPAGEPPKKKRGRPSKAEYEIRLAEYAARGESYPAPRKSKTPRQSTESYAPTAVMFPPGTADTGEGRAPRTPTTMEFGEPSTASAGRRRVRPSKAEIGTRNIPLDTSALGADRPQPPPEDTARSEGNSATEGTVRNTVPEAQPSEPGYGGNPLAQIHEHAGRVEPESGRGGESQPVQHPPESRPWEAYQPPTTT